MAKKKKGKVAIIIAVKPPGGIAPKKPTETANVGVKKEDDPDRSAHNESLCSTCKNDHNTCGDDLNCPCCNTWRGVSPIGRLFGPSQGSEKAVGVKKARGCKGCGKGRTDCVCKAGYC